MDEIPNSGCGLGEALGERRPCVQACSPTDSEGGRRLEHEQKSTRHLIGVTGLGEDQPNILLGFPNNVWFHWARQLNIAVDSQRETPQCQLGAP